MLSDLGAETIDSDVIYHHLIEPEQPLWQALTQHFGRGIVASNGTIDRRALGRIVFSDPGALRELDELTHPTVIQAVLEAIKHSSATIFVIDAVKLIESGMARWCDAVWLIECPSEIQLDRLMKRNGLTHAEALQRIAAQPPLESKRLIANEIIDNGGTIAKTERQVAAAWARLPILSI